MQHLLLATLIPVLLVSPSLAANFEVRQDPEGVTIEVDGELMARYLLKSGPKPILWPLMSPTGKEMTRGYPMREARPNEKSDHVHHRSLWFTHGDVNGVDFWSENAKHGDTVHREFVKVTGGQQAVIVSRNDWLGPDGKKVCEDQRTFSFDARDNTRWIDFDLVVKATEGPVKFGDTKEGSFGVRVAETMKVDAKLGGRIVDSEGRVDGGAWGKRAAWVDYYGPVDGEILGVAIMNHPTSFRFPTHWHVRTYGLFTANPFGIRDFSGDAGQDGSYTLPAEQTMTLRYRVLLHCGDDKTGKVAQFFEEYAKLYSASK